MRASSYREARLSAAKKRIGSVSSRGRASHTLCSRYCSTMAEEHTTTASAKHRSQPKLLEGPENPLSNAKATAATSATKPTRLPSSVSVLRAKLEVTVAMAASGSMQTAVSSSRLN